MPDDFEDDLPLPVGRFARLMIAANEKLIDDWRTRALKLWTVRIALFWGALSGLLVAWPAFSGVVPLWAFAGASIILSAAVAVARLTKQPGADV